MSRRVSMMRAGPLGAELTESQTALRVFLAAGGLVLLGLVLLLLTIWWWRGTKPEPPALGPLEVMSDRKWATAADGERRRLLEEHRPQGASAAAAYQAPVPVDLSVLARDVPSSFDDLRDPVDAAPVTPIDPEAAELASADEVAALDRPSELVVPAGSAGDGPSVPDVAAEVGARTADDDGAADEPAGLAHDGASDASVAAPGAESGESGESDEVHEPQADATTAMSRDETAAAPAPQQPFVPHPGA